MYCCFFLVHSFLSYFFDSELKASEHKPEASESEPSEPELSVPEPSVPEVGAPSTFDSDVEGSLSLPDPDSRRINRCIVCVAGVTPVQLFNLFW